MTSGRDEYMASRHVDFEAENKRRYETVVKTGGAAHGGLTVRDYFAAKALQGLLTAKSGNVATFAHDAYDLADAMMYERERLHVTVRGQVTVEEAFGL
jgi:hypothetical protein